jgi:hypothetical protein
LTPEHVPLLIAADELEVDIAFDVLHSMKPINIKALLERDGESNMGRLAATQGDDVFIQSWTPGGWRVKHPGLPSDD